MKCAFLIIGNSICEKPNCTGHFGLRTQTFMLVLAASAGLLIRKVKFDIFSLVLYLTLLELAETVLISNCAEPRRLQYNKLPFT